MGGIEDVILRSFGWSSQLRIDMLASWAMTGFASNPRHQARFVELAADDSCGRMAAEALTDLLDSNWAIHGFLCVPGGSDIT
jgi:hypothetical protein